MLVTSVICLLLWVVSLKYAEKRNKDLKFHKDVISDYINPSKYLQAGFIFLSIGLGIFGYLIQDINTIASYCFYAGSFGSLLTMLTRTSEWSTKSSKKDWLHTIGAGLALAVTSLACLILSYGVSDGLFGFALSIPLYSVLGALYRMDAGDKERIVAYPLILWFVINACGLWFGLPAWTIF